MTCCKECGKILGIDDIAIYRRLIHREAEEFLCRNCLADFLKVDVGEINDKIEYFKRIGCTLFK